MCAHSLRLGHVPRFVLYLDCVFHGTVISNVVVTYVTYSSPFGTTNSALHTPSRAALGLKTTCRCVVDTQALQQARSEAETRKRAAVQTVIDSKALANQMREKAREATLLYEQKNSVGLLKEAALEALKLLEVQEAEILDTQKRKEEAARNRAEAEQKEQKCKAFEAPSKVREKLRRRIEVQLTDEEAQRQREMQRKMDEIEKNKELAHQRGEAGVKKAAESRRRAEELNLKSQQARAGRNAFWRLGGGMSRYGGTFSDEFSAKNYHSILTV
ncbi:hypothetical protein PsorP6_018048 [Peronosclerospora sorghi]|uniref:Uncharacterized protein n=1 Tax=Peronosclerospora sorghi TaxID=230839 RepID=A0ACC0WEG0_9STRA|nr:hypothetical protein PsorP6_018048 [Peronosclerospora sorghi]